MKTASLSLFFAWLCLLPAAYAQTPVNQPLVKKIEVSGSAEMEVTPDEIYVSIALKEYFTDKSNKTKVEIDNLEKQLQQAVKDAGIAKENFQIENIYGGTTHWWYSKKDKPTDMLESKRYVLKVNELSKIDNIIAKVDGKGIETINISRYSHSRMSEFRKELKIKALQAAKEKAGYLLQSIGEQAGGVLEIREVSDNEGSYPVYQPRYMSNVASQTRMEYEGDSNSEISFRKIKIRYEIQAVFAIK